MRAREVLGTYFTGSGSRARSTEPQFNLQTNSLLLEGDVPMIRETSNQNCSQIDASVELITPAKAAAYLQKNHNRRLSKAVVRCYADQMSRGEWVLTHQGLAFNCDGRLLDGQHRLEAVVKSGCSVHMLVARNVRDVAQLSMDIGAKRTVSDAAKLVFGKTLTKSTVAVVRGVLDFMANERQLSHMQVIQLAELFEEQLVWVMDVTKGNQKGVSAAAVRAALVVAHCYERNIERLEHFARILAGTYVGNGAIDMAACKLRELALTYDQKRGGNRFVLNFQAQRAIKAFCECQPIKVLRATRSVYAWPLSGNVRGPAADDVLRVLYTEGSVE